MDPMVWQTSQLSLATRIVLCAACSLAAARSAEAGNWPQWRGPAGNSTSDEKDLPLAWSERGGLAWKAPLAGWGTSTPAVWGEAVFLTSQHDDALLLVRLDKQTGKVAWTEKVGAAAVPRKGSARGEQRFHDLHNLASPSPVTDGKTIVAHFGNGDLAAYDFSGKRLWMRNLQQDHGKYTIWWGHANSPVLVGNLVVTVCMQDSLADLGQKVGGGPPAASYLVAHDLATGVVRWRTPRDTGAKAEECDAYTTPVVYQPQRGAAQLVVMGANQLDAYDPATGVRLWYLPGLIGGRTVTGPTIAGDMVFATRGMRGPLVALKLGGEGKLTRRAIEWEYPKGTPDSCCPVVFDNLVFSVTDDGVARCFDRAGGNLKWQQRLKGGYKASPLAADGRVYYLNTTGLCTIVAATSRYQKLTENQLDDETIASPAVSDGRLFLRGRKALYCVEK